MIGWLLLGMAIGFVVGAALVAAGSSWRPQRVQRALENERAALQMDVARRKERIVELEAGEVERERKLEGLRGDVGRAREEIRALSTLLETERVATADKVQLLATTEERMREAFSRVKGAERVVAAVDLALAEARLLLAGVEVPQE